MAQAEVRVVWTDGTAGNWQKVNSYNFNILERNKTAQAWAAK
jgi:hypothetical protein